MLKLLYKELRLAAHPNLFVFSAMGALVLVPAYPYGMVFIFGCLAPSFTFMYNRETNDIYYTALLPVRKRDVVTSKFLMLITAHMAQIIISLPFAFLRTLILPDGNPAGIEANVAYYGFGLIIYAVFDLVFTTQFFKTAHKVGKSFLVAIIPATIIMIAMEAIVHFPGFSWLDSIEPADLVKQLPILVFGIIAYISAIFAAYRISCERFEKVDL
ncbi:ABC-2 transporter permease [Clostridiaceae bacterium OttesenSCG-928-D20]|nr:ABC-2 transporter permease [Clostridiaceae bacterium OttesenSCG-928-D20]